MSLTFVTRKLKTQHLSNTDESAETEVEKVDKSQQPNENSEILDDKNREPRESDIVSKFCLSPENPN